jgi:PAS domain S-box-containing protein
MVNKEYCKLGLYEESDVVGTSWTKQIPPEDLDRLKEYNRKRLIDPKSVPDQYEFKFIRKDGKIRNSLMSVAVIPTHQKIVCSFIDITERKQAEEVLRETNEYLENLFNYANAPIIVWDPTLVITRFNHAFEDLSGYNAEQITGKNINVLFPKEKIDTSLNLIKSAISGERWETVEIEIQRKDGDSRIVLWNSANILDKDGTTVIATIAQGHDITARKRAEAEVRSLFETSERSRSDLLSILEDQKRAEEEIQKLNAGLETRVVERTSQLEAANKELEAFSYSVSHDLRAPLRAIDGFSRIVVEEYAKKLDAEGNRLLNVICANTKKMDELITDLLNLSRVSRGEMKVIRVDMVKLAKSTYSEAASPDVQQQYEFSVEPLPEAYCDPALVRQVWTNLISNAIKFTATKDVRRIEIGSRTEDGMNIYFVKDSGVGFDPQYASKLFGVFQRLHKSEDFEGTGIGLAIVQRIIHRHGGKVWAEGKVGEGATFYFSLPSGRE